MQILLDLAALVGGFVDRNADLAIRAGERAREQARVLAFDIEVADLAEIEEALVEAGPDMHAPAADVMRQVVDIMEAAALRLRITRAEPVETSS